MAFSPNGEWLAAVIEHDHDQGAWVVQVWRTDSGAPVGPPMYHGMRINSLAFSPDSRRLVTATGDNAARIWQIASGKELFQLRHSAPVYSASYSSDGRQILTGSIDTMAKLWDAATGEPLAEPMFHNGRVLHAEFSRDGLQVLTAGWQDRTVKLWDLRPPRAASIVFPHESWVTSVSFDGTGESALTATGTGVFTADKNNVWGGGDHQQVVLWDAVHGEPWVAPILPDDSEALTAQFTRIGPLALTVEAIDHSIYSQVAQCWDLSAGNPLGDPIRTETTLTCARFDDEGRVLATGSEDGTIELWDVQTQQRLTPPMGMRDRIRSIRFSPDGRALIAAGDDHTATLWDVATGRMLASPLRHEAEVWFAQFSRGGDKVVTASADFTARIWSTKGTLIATLRHRGAVEYAEFSPDGTLVVTASADSTARIWNATTGAQRATLQHSGLVLSACFSPDGLRILTTSIDRTARLWDSATGHSLADPFRHGGWVVGAAFSPDGRRVITASLDRTARIWEVPVALMPIPSWLPDLAEAVAGQRLDADRNEQSMPWDARLILKRRLEGDRAGDPYVEWVRGFADGWSQGR